MRDPVADSGTAKRRGGDQADGGDREQRDRTTISLERKGSTGANVPWKSRSGSNGTTPGLVDIDEVRKWQAGQSSPPRGPVSV
jgi:hypothetical protein